MYLHHHPSQAKKLAMAAKAANNQQEGGGQNYHVGGYDFRKSYDNGGSNFRNFYDEGPRQRRPYRGSYADDEDDDDEFERPRRRRPFRGSYDAYRPRRADYRDTYDQRGPVVGGRYGNRMSAANQNTGVSYNKNGGIDWNNPTLKGSVFVDRGEDDEDDL
ncbi:hypothetical protein BCR42DRAFT_451851 [Absidia repens]|uniref:Uncharacterized protein n=1 Tax=Absidia repens TaxID=90262 RepID=A0A1X2IGA5_9FUNG|nr:hypothetical protein BCR42DRAFT_451851 [Absidia repens]